MGPAGKIISRNAHARMEDIAMPYRSDGIACALRKTYRAEIDHVPADMLELLIALDSRVPINDPG